MVDWSALAGVTDIAALEATAAPMLETETFSTQTVYDALNRPVEVTTPDNSVTLPTYGEASLLDHMAVRLRGAAESTPFVSNIDYNARGQREQITYATEDGSNFTTTYQYHPDTFQLTGLQTVRHQDGAVLQDLRYIYDPAGNITSIRDEAQQTVYFNNVEVEPHQSYTYDALYRLTRAEGREHAAQNNVQRDATAFVPLLGIPHPNSPEALQPYAELYSYDSVGNLTRVRHIGGAIDRWTRRYQVAENSNRLLATSLPGDADGIFSATFDYDAHGNMIRMPHLPLMRWDVKDQLQATSSQAVEGGTPEITYYVYNSDGERVRKVTERQAPANASPDATPPTRRSERLYLGGMEIYREYAGDGTSITLQRETLHVMDDQQRVALVETRTQGSDDSPAQAVRYQLSNHLGSATVELDANAALISYEEYYPYGATAYCTGRSAAEVSLKRYRYAAKEQDEETSLHYYGARYYASWLGRWTTVDPAGIAEGTNLYQYVSDNPVRMGDPSGMAEEDATKVRVHSGPQEDALATDLRLFEQETEAYKKARADYNREYSFYLGMGRYQHPERRAHLDAYYYYYYSALNRWARDLKAQGSVLSARVGEARRLAPFFQSMRTAETAIKWWAAADLAIVSLGTVALTFSAEQVSAYGFVTAWRVEGALGAATASSPFLMRLATNPTVQAAGAVSAAILEADALAQGSSVPGSTPSIPRSAPVAESARAIGTKKLGQSGSTFRTVERGTEQLMFKFEQQTVFSGHGVWHKKASGFLRVPPGTTLTVYTKKGEAMGDRLGQAIELNVDLGAVYKKVYKPGQLVPNLTLYPAGRLSLMGKPVTVQQPTLLKDLLKPDMGSCHWAACFKIDKR
jgi:RHS repeat-associated protein